jgi:ABC-type nitrate/sulfonate/bicarbonate transport system substrate-binding protein
MKTSKMKFLVVTGLISVAAAMVKPSATAAFDKLVVSYGALTGGQAPLWLAKEARLYEKHGLDVNLVYVSSSFQPVMGLLSGSTQFMNYSALPSFEAYLRGADTVLLASAADRVEHHLVVHPSITSINDLRGKTIGIGSLGSLIDVVLREGLRLSGISDKEVTIVPVGDSAARISSLQIGKVQGTAVNGAYLLVAHKSGYKTLIDFTKLPIEVSTSSILSTKSYVTKNFDTTLKFLKAWTEGLFMFRANREIGIKILRKYTRIDDAEIIEAVYNQYRDINKATARPSLDVVHSMHRLLSMMRPQKTGRNPDGFVELSFFRELETSGFLERIKRQYGTGQENP